MPAIFRFLFGLIESVFNGSWKIFFELILRFAFDCLPGIRGL